MTDTAAGAASAAEAAVAEAFRQEWGKIVATLIRMTGRLGPGRGVRPGRVHYRADPVGVRRRAGPAGRLAHDDGA